MGEPENIVREYTAQEAAELAGQWLEVFGRDRQGANTKAYLWHVFSGGRYPCLCGDEAREAYAQQAAPEYIVLSNQRDVAFVTDALPGRCDLSDYYVFPKNFAWTFAVTHEDGWLDGPYFAQHRDAARLNAENVAKLEKARDIAAARLKGWL